MEQRETVISVSELTRAIRSLLEGHFGRVWVSGEVFTFKRHSSGHLYFTLKDGQAQIAAVMFRNQARGLAFRPCEGMTVECRGRVTVYEPQGKYQLIVDSMRPSGEGNLLAALEELKRRLAAEGLFDEAHKKPLPLLPRRVGIVTSPTGAAVRDMLRVLHDRFPVSVLVCPAAVQGATAAPSLVAGLLALERIEDVDVIIIGRGGGSLEDLWAFNDERLVRAIHAARKPVVSAVGHEVDFLLTDFVADRRAPTPTAAAELVVPRYMDLDETLRTSILRLERAIQRRLGDGRRDLHLARMRLTDPRSVLARHAMRLDELVGRAEGAVRYGLLDRRGRLRGAEGRLRALHPRTRIDHDRHRLVSAARRLERALASQLLTARNRLDRATSRLHLLGPEDNLRRGYSIVRRSGTEEVVRDSSSLRRGEHLDITMARGSASARVETTGPSTRPPPVRARTGRAGTDDTDVDGQPVQGKLL